MSIMRLLASAAVVLAAQTAHGDWLPRDRESQSERPTMVVVLDLEGRGLRADTVAALSEALRDHIAARSNIHVIPVTAVTRAGHSGGSLGCMAVSCLVGIGERMDAKYVIAGSARCDPDGRCVVSVHVIDVERSGVIGSLAREWRAGTGCEAVAATLASEIVGAPRSPTARQAAASAAVTDRRQDWRLDPMEMAAQGLTGAPLAGLAAMGSFIRFADDGYDPGFIGMPLWTGLGASWGVWLAAKWTRDRPSYWRILGGSMLGSLAGYGVVSAAGRWSTECDYCKEKAFVAVIVSSAAGGVLGAAWRGPLWPFGGSSNDDLSGVEFLPETGGAVWSQDKRPIPMMGILRVTF